VALATTDDALLGGKVRFTQPRDGYRAAIDPVLLAASVPVQPGQRVLDLGCGAGAVFLCLLAREPTLSIVGVDKDAELVSLAEANAAANERAEQVEIAHADLAMMPVTWNAETMDHVVMNPPYLEADRADASPQAGRAAAGIEDGPGLAAWVARAHRCLKPRARMTAIHRADRLGDLLSALEGRFGEAVVFPLWPKAGVAAKRVIVTARRDVRAPLTLAPGLVLHEPDGGWTKTAGAALRGAGLDLTA